MSFGEIDHFASMLAGCESINSGQPLNPDGRYSFAVLKLHAGDMGLVAGQEGFLDSIKKGAQNAVKWVKQLIAAIGKWMKETFLKLIGKGKSLKISKETANEVLIPGLERALEKLKDVKEIDVSKAIELVEKYISAGKTETSLESINDNTVKELRSVIDKVEAQIKSLKENSDEDNKEASKLGVELRKISEACGSITNAVNKAVGGKGKVGKNLTDQVHSGSIGMVRSALLADIDDNRLTIEDIKYAIAYAEENRKDLYVEYEENALAPATIGIPSGWNEEEYFSAVSAINVNFSKMRLTNLVKMKAYLREKGVKRFKQI